MPDERISLQFTARGWQSEIYRALRRFSVLIIHRRAGKTILAILKLIASALACRQPLGHFGYLAPELKQAKAVVWEELKKYATMIPGVEVNESELWVRFPHNKAKIRLFGADNINALRGLYFDGLVVDEVSQMERDFWGLVLLPALTDRYKLDPSLGWALFIGTPEGENMLSGLYTRAVASADGGDWYGKLLTVHDTEVFTEEEIAKIRAETPTEEQFRQEWLCDFQVGNSNALMSREQVMAATKKVLRESEFNFAPKIIGVDVAWMGGDRSVIMKRQGLQSFKPIVKRGIPEKAFAGLVAQEIMEWQADKVFVDVTGGYGGEVLSRLLDGGHNVEGVTFSAKPITPRFLNLRAEMWWKMADWVKGGGSLWKDEAIIAELCSPSYSMDNASNRIKLESKDDIKDRIGVSPDLADALALTFAYPVATAGMQVVRKVSAEWDPYDDNRG